jgi:hypothetical protein
MKFSLCHFAASLQAAASGQVARCCVLALAAVVVLGTSRHLAAQTPTDLYYFGSISEDANQPFSPSVIARARRQSLRNCARRS